VVLPRQVRYKIHMRNRLLALLLCLTACLAWAEEPGPPTLPAATATALLDFDLLPERNVVFSVDEDRATAFNLAQTLLLELDYGPTANQEQRGDLIGPFISKRRYRNHQLAEIVAVRLVAQDGGTGVTIRSLFVVVDNGFLVDQSARRPTRAVRRFPELYDAKKNVVEQTSYFSVYDLLEHARANLNAGTELEKTLRFVQLAEQATLPNTPAGRQTRELLHAVQAEVNRRQKLQQAADALRAKIREATERNNWAEVWLAADELAHVLLANDVPRTDAMFVEALAAQDRARRALARRGRLVAFSPQLGPGENNDVVVGFTVLNVSNRPVGAFDVVVEPLDANGQPSAGRSLPARPVHLKPPQPIAPGATYNAVVTISFGAPVQPAQAAIRITRTSR